MWVPFHRRPSFSLPKKRKKTEEAPDPFFLSKPKTEKLDGVNVFTHSQIEVGHSSLQGYRASMEDQHIIEDFQTLPDHSFLAIMDGHAGEGAARYVALRLLEVIEDQDEWKEYLLFDPKKRSENTELLSSLLVNSCIAMDAELMDCDFMDGSGCTCVCTIISPTHIICANVGDSRCVIASNSRTISMTEDHKPSTFEEHERISKAGGFVAMDRVNGELAMSRALGDFQYKVNPNLSVEEQQVICIPDVSIHTRCEGDQLVILACDGVWDVMENHEGVNYLLNLMNQKDDTKKVDPPSKKSKKAESSDVDGTSASTPLTAENLAEELIDMALRLGSTDNISAVVAILSKNPHR